VGCDYRGRRIAGRVEATTPSMGRNEDGAAGSLDRLEHLPHFAGKVFDLFERSQRLLIVLLRREEEQLRLGKDGRERVGEIVPQLGQRRLGLSHQSNERYRSRR